jgi:putative transposase
MPAAPKPSFSSPPAVLALVPGSDFTANGRLYRILSIPDLQSLLAQDVETGAITRIPIAEISRPGATNPSASNLEGIDLCSIPDTDWTVARQRYEAIEPLLAPCVISTEAVSERAQVTGKHRATLYRWLNAYLKSGTLTALLPNRPGAAAGQKRLEQDVEDIISAIIKERYLQRQKITPEQIAREVIARCVRLGIVAPHSTTVRRRIAALAEETKVRAREGGQAARQRFAPSAGSFPEVDWPLSVVQIDHTPVDLELVDDIRRQPIGKPWITVAFDIFSRMVAGFYVAFDPPGALAAGLCLAHAILPKELWLAKYDITSPWPVWGFMNAVHCDNAKEFHGAMLKKACDNYGIALEFRPVRQPHYGGHIERFLGTFAEEIHRLPGTTFSNPAERGTYDSEGQSTMTLFEFERWLANLIVNVYHRRVHSALGISPLEKYEQGILGVPGKPGRGLPARCLDETKLRLDFLPYVERTVQRPGISIDGIHYYADLLRPWIGTPDPDHPGRKRQFIVRRDPRDISVVYFYDPQAQQYLRVPYRDTSRPSISVWELQKIRRRLQDEGRRSVDEQIIFDTWDRMRALEQQAKRTTKKMRRDQQRRRLHDHRQDPLPAAAPGEGSPRSFGQLEPADQIRPFSEVEVVE